MRLAIEVLAIYGIYVFGTALLIWRFSTKDRGPSIVVSMLVPFLFVVSFIEMIVSVLLRRNQAIGPCPVGLDEAELLVERQRQKMFGGDSEIPHLASDWAKLYQMTVESEAERVQAFARRMLTV
ncbi:MAG: hypothetical protein ACRYFU_14785 [Janthinobacterium lividum]